MNVSSTTVSFQSVGAKSIPQNGRNDHHGTAAGETHTILVNQWDGVGPLPLQVVDAAGVVETRALGAPAAAPAEESAAEPIADEGDEPIAVSESAVDLLARIWPVLLVLLIGAALFTAGLILALRGRRR